MTIKEKQNKVPKKVCNATPKTTFLPLPWNVSRAILKKQRRKFQKLRLEIEMETEKNAILRQNLLKIQERVRRLQNVLEQKRREVALKQEEIATLLQANAIH